MELKIKGKLIIILIICLLAPSITSCGSSSETRSSSSLCLATKPIYFDQDKEVGLLGFETQKSVLKENLNYCCACVAFEPVCRSKEIKEFCKKI